MPNEPKWSEHRLKEPKERIREASVDEEQKINDALRDDFRPVFAFAVATGLRLSEAVNLTWQQVDWDVKVIHVLGKGDKVRSRRRRRY